MSISIKPVSASIVPGRLRGALQKAATKSLLIVGLAGVFSINSSQKSEPFESGTILPPGGPICDMGPLRNEPLPEKTTARFRLSQYPLVSFDDSFAKLESFLKSFSKLESFSIESEFIKDFNHRQNPELRPKLNLGIKLKIDFKKIDNMFGFSSSPVITACEITSLKDDNLSHTIEFGIGTEVDENSPLFIEIPYEFYSAGSLNIKIKIKGETFPAYDFDEFDHPAKSIPINLTASLSENL